MTDQGRRSAMARPIRASQLVAAVAVALLAAACGGGAGASNGPGATTGAAATTAVGATPRAGTPGGAATGSGDGGATLKAACDLLTDDEIKTITGYDVSEKAPDVSIGYENNCQWEFKDAAWEISLGVLGSGGEDAYGRMVQVNSGGDEISGIGDKAIRLENAGNPIALVGDRLVDLQMTGYGTKGFDEKLLQKVVEKVGS